MLHITEHTGRGVPRITRTYGRETIKIKENSILVTIPFNRLRDEVYAQEPEHDVQVNAQVDVQVNLEEILVFCGTPKSLMEIAEHLGYKDRRTVRKALHPLLDAGRLAMTNPDKPTSSKQKYITIK